MGRVSVKQASVLVVATVLAVIMTGCALVDNSSNNNNDNNNNKNGCSDCVNPNGDITSVNHIIFMAQENRSFDTYFGHLNDYRATQGFPQDVDGMPANASNPADDGSQIQAFHFNTTCIENRSEERRVGKECRTRVSAYN